MTVSKGKSPSSKKMDLRQLLETISRAKYMWESTFDAIRDPVMIIDRHYTIERANLAAAERAGKLIREFVGKKCFEIFAKRTEICPHCPLQETLRVKETRSVQIEELMPARDFQVNSYPMLGDEGTPADRVVHHYLDITEQKRLQKQLIQSEKMAAIGLLAGGVAHEINNPLAGILAFTQLLKKEMPSAAQAQEDLSEIEEAAKRCKKIVEDLLLFSRPPLDGDRKSIALDEAVERILPLVRLNLRHKNVSIAASYEEDLPFVNGSLVRLQQVFLNLIHNAAQAMFTKGGGEVTVGIRASKDRKRIVTEVTDRGCGIPKEDLSRIFDPFYSTKERNEGTGLGLSICYSIVSEHGGKIEVESEMGEGCVFRVILPAQRQE